MTVRSVLAAALVLALVPAAHADTLATDAAAPWEMCGECHGLDGLSAEPRFPRLAGQNHAYLEKQLRDFRDGRQRNDADGIMRAVAVRLSDADMDALSTAFQDSEGARP